MAAGNEPGEAVQAFESLLRALHELIAKGDDGDEAEAIRDDMDPLWIRMTDDEKERMGKLSEDLYALHEESNKPD